MSWYLAGKDGIIGQFASASGLSDLRKETDAKAGEYPALVSFLDSGVTKNVLLCRMQLQNLAKHANDATVTSTANGLAAMLTGGLDLVCITQGFGTAGAKK